MTTLERLSYIHQGDCVAFMKTLPDKCIDLTLTDFPYGIGESYASFDDSRANLRALVSAAMPEILRVSKRALIACGVANMWLYPEPTWVLNWTTPAGSGCSPWGFCCWQPILAYGKDPYLSEGEGRRPDAFVHTESSEKNGHPCPKPIQIWKKFLLRGSRDENDIVFDPFMGSGTTALACEEHKRRWLGCELEPKYVAIANDRVKAFKAQGQLF